MINWVAIGNVLRATLPIITALVAGANAREERRAEREMMKEVINEVLDERSKSLQ